MVTLSRQVYIYKLPGKDFKIEILEKPSELQETEDRYLDQFKKMLLKKNKLSTHTHKISQRESNKTRK